MVRETVGIFINNQNTFFRNEVLYMYEGDGLEKTGNEKLDYEILRWINNRMIELTDLYIDLGDSSGWDEDYLMCCFPRSFVEDNFP